MRQKIPYVLAAALLVVALPLFASGEEEATAPAMEGTSEPQYGGTITVLNFLTDALGVPDPHYGSGSTAIKNMVGERIQVGDVHQFGIRGNGAFAFTDDAGLPLPYKMGGVAESWEVTSDKLILKVRDGIMWSGKTINDVMEPREVTAEDIVFTYRRWFDEATGRGGYIRGLDWIKKPEVEAVYALDEDTVVFETNYYNGNWDGTLQGGGGQLYAPESYAASEPDKLTWENMIGTGPFVVKEYVPGSHLTLGANELYWQKAIIDGKEYRTPFVDEYVMPMIKDETTAVAALQTATADAYLRVTPPHVPALERAFPDLQSRKSGAGLANVIAFDTSKAPFDNRDVRRALMIGTDRSAVNGMLMEPDLEYNMHPFAAGWEGWVPVDEMPESTRMLFTYDPEMAKQMLADAGYPNGFEIDVLAMNVYQNDDIAEIVADQWQDLGVTMNITVKDGAAVNKEVRPPAHMEYDAVAWVMVTHTPILFAHTYYGTKGPRNAGYYRSEYFDERMLGAIREQDDAKRVQMLTEANLRQQDDVAAIPFAFPSWRTFWWPWVKNIYGEVWYHIHTPDAHNWWLDQALKEEMGH